MAVTDAVQTARALAQQHPAGKLPCPICATSLNAKNLESHLAKVHANASASTGPWRGIDRRVLITAVIGFVVAVIGSVALIASDTVAPKTGGAYALIAVFVVPFGVALASLLEATKGKVFIDGNDLVMVWAFGLRRTRVSLQGVAIETGPFYVGRTGSVVANSDYNTGKGYDVREGSYLRFTNGGAKLTLAMKGDTLFRETWNASGYTAGKKRKWYDLKVPREAMVAIEYELAGRGLLQPAARAA